MADYKYSIENYNKEHMARAVGTSLSISTKQSIEICSFIKRKNTQKAKKMLDEVVKLQKPVPFKRFNGDVGHKRGDGMAAGRYPIKACKLIMKLIESVEANAQFKGLSTANLVITHACAQKASTPWHPGRKRRRKMKRTSIELVVEERAVKDKKKEAKAGEKPKIKTKTALDKKEVKEEKKAEPKKEEKKIEEKKPEVKKEEPPKEEKKVEEKKPEPKPESKEQAPKNEEKKVEK